MPKQHDKKVTLILAIANDYVQVFDTETGAPFGYPGQHSQYACERAAVLYAMITSKGGEAYVCVTAGHSDSTHGENLGRLMAIHLQQHCHIPARKIFCDPARMFYTFGECAEVASSLIPKLVRKQERPTTYKVVVVCKWWHCLRAYFWMVLMAKLYPADFPSTIVVRPKPIAFHDSFVGITRVCWSELKSWPRNLGGAVKFMSSRKTLIDYVGR